MMRIYYADMAKAFKRKDYKRRPVVVLEDLGDMVKVMKVTSRNRDDKYHTRMNNFLIYGFCDVSHVYKIPKKYLMGFVRDCTTSEIENILYKSSKINSKSY